MSLPLAVLMSKTYPALPHVLSIVFIKVDGQYIYILMNVLIAGYVKQFVQWMQYIQTIVFHQIWMNL